MRPKGSSAVLERRRLDAVAMLQQGLKPTAVARVLHTSRASVSRWHRAMREGGVKALAAQPVPGRPRKLGSAPRRQIGALLRKGPTAYGFGTELWTLARIATVIERLFGVRYHPSQVWRILRSLGWSCQKPESRARERDEPAIAHWRQTDWPRLKKRRPGRAERAVPG